MRWLDGITVSWHVFEQAPGDSEGQRSLACFIQPRGLLRVGHELGTEQCQSSSC